MAGNAVATTFITGAAGFIGTELLKVFMPVEPSQGVFEGELHPVLGALYE